VAKKNSILNDLVLAPWSVSIILAGVIYFTSVSKTSDKLSPNFSRQGARWLFMEPSPLEAHPKSFRGFRREKTTKKRK